MTEVGSRLPGVRGAAALGMALELGDSPGRRVTTVEYSRREA